MADTLPARAGGGATCGTQEKQEAVVAEALPARAGIGATCGTQEGQVDVVAASSSELNWKEIAARQQLCQATLKAMESSSLQLELQHVGGVHILCDVAHGRISDPRG